MPLLVSEKYVFAKRRARTGSNFNIMGMTMRWARSHYLALYRALDAIRGDNEVSIDDLA